MSAISRDRGHADDKVLAARRATVIAMAKAQRWAVAVRFADGSHRCLCTLVLAGAGKTTGLRVSIKRTTPQQADPPGSPLGVLTLDQPT